MLVVIWKKEMLICKDVVKNISQFLSVELDSPGQDVFIQYTFCIKLLRYLKIKAAIEAIYTKLHKKLGFNTVNAKYVIKYWLWCKGIAFTEAI